VCEEDDDNNDFVLSVDGVYTHHSCMVGGMVWWYDTNHVVLHSLWCPQTKKARDQRLNLPIGH
jgi:hypothetical protein